jgi:lipopolysaccharide export system ATP-binding protein
MIEPDRGTVILSDVDVTRCPMYRRGKEGRMGYLAQESSVFRKLTVSRTCSA